MKRILLSTAAVALISGASYAADLPIMEAPAAIIAPTPVAANWTGFYLGIHGGYGWANANGGCREFDDGNGTKRDRSCNNDGDFEDDFNFEDSDFEGAVIGGQVGVNWQWDWFVLGAEGDASWSGIDLDDEFDDNDNNNNDDDDDDDNDAGVDWLASARLRAGVGLDRVLIYGTGGVGFAGFEEGDRFGNGNGNGNNNNNNNNDDDDDDDDTEIGWVAGGGAEFLVTDNVSIGAEYLHYGFDDDDDDDDDNGRNNSRGGRNDNMGLDDIDVVRGRVNVKFGSLFGGG